MAGMVSSTSIVQKTTDNPVHRDAIQIRKWIWEICSAPDDPITRTNTFLDEAVEETLKYFKKNEHLLESNNRREKLLMQCTQEVYEYLWKRRVPAAIAPREFRRIYRMLKGRLGEHAASDLVFWASRKMDELSFQLFWGSEFWGKAEIVLMRENKLGIHDLRAKVRAAYCEVTYHMVQRVPHYTLHNLDEAISEALRMSEAKRELDIEKPEKSAVELKRTEIMGYVQNASEAEIDLMRTGSPWMPSVVF